MKAGSFAVLWALAAVPAAAQAPALDCRDRAGRARPRPPRLSAAVPRPASFTSDAGMMFSVIKPDKVADFEMVMGRIKDALSKSDDPSRKQMALGWRVFKGLEAAPAVTSSTCGSWIRPSRTRITP